MSERGLLQTVCLILGIFMAIGTILWMIYLAFQYRLAENSFIALVMLVIAFSLIVIGSRGS